MAIGDREVAVRRGTTIWEAAASVGIDIPVACHDPRYDPVGVCRLCVLDVGASVLAASCVRLCEDGLDVQTATPQVESQRRTLVRLLMADQPREIVESETPSGKLGFTLMRVGAPELCPA